MANFLFQLFILLPLSVGMGVALAFTLTPFFFLENAGQSATDIGTIVAMIVCFAIFLGIAFLYLKIRGFEWGSRWWWFGLLLSPVRPVLQLIACLFAIVAMVGDSIYSDKDFADGSSTARNVTSLLFNFESTRTKPIARQSEEEGEISSAETSSREEAQPRLQERKGNGAIKARNVCFQLFVLLPITALQCFLIFFPINLMMRENQPHPAGAPLLVVGVILLVPIAMLVAKIRGHEPSFDYFDCRFVVEDKKTGVRAGGEYEGNPQDFDTNRFNRYVEERGAKKVSGGWNTLLRPVTIFAFLCSGFMVFFQIIAVLVAIFSNPYKGRIFSWYGRVNYDLCNAPFLQKILHFFFGFIVLAYPL